MPVLARLRRSRRCFRQFHGMAAAIGLILAAHAGLLVLVALVAGWPWPRHDPAPVIVRSPVDPFARQFIYFFARRAGVRRHPRRRRSSDGRDRSVGIAPMIILSGLARGRRCRRWSYASTRQHIVIAAWFGLLMIPPIMAAAAVVVLPWLNVDLRVGSRFRQWRTFSPKASSVAPERRCRSSPAIRARPRSSLSVPRAAPVCFSSATPERSPWVNADAIKARARSGMADHRYRRRTPPAVRWSDSPIWWPRSRVHSSAGARPTCRSFASVGGDQAEDHGRSGSPTDDRSQPK